MKHYTMWQDVAVLAAIVAAGAYLAWRWRRAGRGHACGCQAVCDRSSGLSGEAETDRSGPSCPSGGPCGSCPATAEPGDNAGGGCRPGR
ncbi:MAG: hypothetical protein ABSF26_08785 [Thermoguttaceae bacterium]